MTTRFWFDNGANVINSSGGADTIYAYGGDDIVNGGSQVDELHGGDGSDTLDGGSDSDELFGEDGDDTLTGGAGTDTLDGGEGVDTLAGGDGNDMLHGDGQGDTLDGGSGINTAVYDSSSDVYCNNEENIASLDGPFSEVTDHLLYIDNVTTGNGNDYVQFSATEAGLFSSVIVPHRGLKPSPSGEGKGR